MLCVVKLDPPLRFKVTEYQISSLQSVNFVGSKTWICWRTCLIIFSACFKYSGGVHLYHKWYQCYLACYSCSILSPMKFTISVVPRFPDPWGFPDPRGFPEIPRKSGTGSGTGMNFCRWLGKIRGQGPIGDGDKLGIGEYLGKVPQNSPKIGVGMGKTISGNIGNQLGMGIG